MSGRPPQQGLQAEPPAAPWLVEARVEAAVTLPGGEASDRDGLHAWLWDQAAGLLGIDEGAVSVDEAFGHGLAPTPLVIDAAAAPADRDWVAGLPVADVTWWFGDETSARAAASLVAGIRGCRVGRILPVPTADHEAAARAGFGPLVVAGFGTVRPAWEPGAAGRAADGATTIFIEPGTGFGTGLHETTQLCLAALTERHHRRGSLGRVLDFGSGSGILAIAAAVCGANSVTAVEIDRRVHDAIRGNAARNGVATRIRVEAALAPDDELHDLVLANIVAPVLLEHAADLCRRVGPHEGCIVLSGLRDGDLQAVTSCYAERLGCEPEIRRLGDWRSLVFTRGWAAG